MTTEALARRADETDRESWITAMCGTPREWQPYVEFSYRKRYCDIRLHDGSEHGPCWPNGGMFYTLTGDGLRLPECDVAQVRYYMRKGEKL